MRLFAVVAGFCPDVLPVVHSNEISVHAGDGFDYLSTYHLNRSFEFCDVATQATLNPIHHNEFGVVYVIGYSSSVSMFVRLYSHITVPQLSTLCTVHGIPVPWNPRKPALRLQLLGHYCGPACPGIAVPLLFRRTKKRRSINAVVTIDTRTFVQSNNGPKVAVNENRRSATHDINVPTVVSRKTPEPASSTSVICDADPAVSDNFPYIASDQAKRDIIADWLHVMDPVKWLPLPCAVCGCSTRRSAISTVDPSDFDLTLLRNPSLPVETLPTTYNFDAYERAILYPLALRNKTALGPMDVCAPCAAEWASGRQPLDSLANFQYYARDELPDSVRTAFAETSLFDLMMICQSRATRITHLFTNKKGHPLYKTNPTLSQGYSSGNVAVIAQDVAKVRTLLPPDLREIHEAMCAVFVGASTVPTRENIHALSPVLVSKKRIATLLEFLLERNPWYKAAGVKYSSSNMNDLFDAGECSDIGIPRGVEIACLPSDSGAAANHSSFAERGDDDNDGADGDLVMEAIGYTAGERDNKSYKTMKASALTWCLDRKKFIQMQSGSKFITDRDPGLLTYTFPQLDPWGIGGFYEPLRESSQHITFERQVRNMLRQHDGA